MNVLFIINEHAGNGKGRNVWKALTPKLKLDYTYRITEYAGHAAAIAGQEAKKHPGQPLLIIAVGGDGTIHEVIQGVSGVSHVTVGALKAGSGNDFTRGYPSFKHAEDINRYVRMNSAGSTLNVRRKAMDVGQLQIRPASDCGGINKGGKMLFVNNAGIGFDAFVSTTVNRSALKRILNKVRLGSLIYALTVVWALFAFRRFHVTVGQGAASTTFRKVWFIAMCNQPYFGGGMKISPGSVPNDGKLEVTIVHGLARWKLLLVFITVFWGGHTGFKEVSVMEGTTFTFQTDRAMLCHTDGEYAGELHPGEWLECGVAENMWHSIASE